MLERKNNVFVFLLYPLSQISTDICGSEPESPVNEGEEVADFCYFCAKVVPKEENQD